MVTVTIVSDPPGALVDDDNNAFEHLIGSNITFTCEVNSTLTFNDSDFVWGCSTGCFADMEVEQIINITEIQVTDSGVLNCSVVFDGVEYNSEPYDLRVTGIVFILMLCDKTCRGTNVTEFWKITLMGAFCTLNI